jgi:protein gp37
MGDLFHKNVAEKYILDVFEMMIENSRHTFLILTKRPKRLLESPELIKISKRLPLYPHIWMGVSVENQKTADERIQILYQIPAAKRFVSCEPLLSSLDLKIGGCNHCQRFGERLAENGHWKNPCSLCGRVRNRNLDWIICGGENGPGARPMHTDWARSIRDQCNDANTPFFFKGWGKWQKKEGVKIWTPDSNPEGKDCFVRIGKKTAGHLLDGVFHRQVPWGEFG